MVRDLPEAGRLREQGPSGASTTGGLGAGAPGQGEDEKLEVGGEADAGATAHRGRGLLPQGTALSWLGMESAAVSAQ